MLDPPGGHTGTTSDPTPALTGAPTRREILESLVNELEIDVRFSARDSALKNAPQRGRRRVRSEGRPSTLDITP